MFAQRSAAKRFAWEQSEAHHREETERAQRFLDVKRELFARFLAAHSSFYWGTLIHIRRPPGAPRVRPYPTLDRDRERLRDPASEIFQTSRRLAEEIALVVPDAANACDDLNRECLKAIDAAQASKAQEVEWPYSEYADMIKRVREGMARWLGMV